MKLLGRGSPLPLSSVSWHSPDRCTPGLGREGRPGLVLGMKPSRGPQTKEVLLSQNFHSVWGLTWPKHLCVARRVGLRSPCLCAPPFSEVSCTGSAGAEPCQQVSSLLSFHHIIPFPRPSVPPMASQAEGLGLGDCPMRSGPWSRTWPGPLRQHRAL